MTVVSRSICRAQPPGMEHVNDLGAFVVGHAQAAGATVPCPKCAKPLVARYVHCAVMLAAQHFERELLRRIEATPEIRERLCTLLAMHTPDPFYFPEDCAALLEAWAPDLMPKQRIYTDGTGPFLPPV